MDLVLPWGCLDNWVGGAPSLGEGLPHPCTSRHSSGLAGAGSHVHPLPTPSFITHSLPSGVWGLAASPGVGGAKIRSGLQAGQREEGPMASAAEGLQA